MEFSLPVSVACASSSRSVTAIYGPLTVPVKVAVPLMDAPSLVGTFHSTTLSNALKVASPLEAFSSVTLRTSAGNGMVTVTASSVGALELPLLAPPKDREDIGPELVREALGLAVDGAPGKLVLSVSLASKSHPELPRPPRKSTVAGRKILSLLLGGWSLSRDDGIKSVS